MKGNQVYQTAYFSTKRVPGTGRKYKTTKIRAIIQSPRTKRLLPLIAKELPSAWISELLVTGKPFITQITFFLIYLSGHD